MFAYVDETGNSGRNIFDQNEYFGLGSILSVTDIAPVVSAVLNPFLIEKGVDRFHANQWPETTVAEIGEQVVAALDHEGPWVFNIAKIHKPYMAPTKFVDVIFDAGENRAVPGDWYWDELNRHVLCLAIDQAMSQDTAKLFWSAFLKDDFSKIIDAADLIEAELKNIELASAVFQVIQVAFQFAREHPKEFTLLNSQTRKAYQASSPNVVAFTQLFQAIHDFAEKEESPPERLIHDKQDEFRTTLSRTYAHFGSVIWEDAPDGSSPDISLADYPLAEFEMPASQDNAGIQATDLLLWVTQRSAKSRPLARLKKLLSERTEDFNISRRMSQLIVHMHLLRHERQRS